MIRAAADPAEVARAVAALGGPGEPAAGVQTRETHISWLFLSGDRAFKLKKPIVLEFLDYGTPERRRWMCLEEVRLNARLAPDLYLGVRAVVPDAGGLRITEGEDPAAIDHLVEMRRYDEAQTLAAALVRGEVGAAEIGDVGRALARFHAGCPAVSSRRGAAAALANVDRNLGELDGDLVTVPDRGQIDAVRRFMHAFIRAHAATLDERAAAGLTRECHGDLRAEHVVLRPSLSIVDCVEFDAGLRTLDVADDLSFLAMDLCALDAAWCADDLAAAYRHAGGDCGDDRLLWFFAVHRALVRAKVALVRAGQRAPGGTAAADDIALAANRLALARRLTWRARGPFLLVVCGVPASGKSHLAQTLAASSGLGVLSSDVVRKQLAGLRPDERAPVEVYAPAFSRRTYAELGRRARLALDRAAAPVIVDATFRRREDRQAFASALGPGCRVMFAECVAPEAVLAARGRAREADPSRVSDATAEIVKRERHAWEPLDEVSAGGHLRLATDRPAGAVVEQLMALLDQRLGQPATARPPDARPTPAPPGRPL